MSSPKRNRRERLFDIADAIKQIEADVMGLTLDEFLNDHKTRNSVAFGLIVIGEAVADFRDSLAAEVPDIPWHKITGLRNQLVHGYFHIDDSALFYIATRQITPLRLSVQRLIDQSSHV